MGIDIYLRWEGQTDLEEKAQYTGFDPTKGFTGYLREAYHGGPYATRELVPEAFEHHCEKDCDDHAVPIPAATLAARLPAVLTIVETRERCVYNETNEKEIEKIRKSYRDFVALAKKKETEIGKPCRVYASY